MSNLRHTQVIPYHTHVTRISHSCNTNVTPMSDQCTIHSTLKLYPVTIMSHSFHTSMPHPCHNHVKHISNIGTPTSHPCIGHITPMSSSCHTHVIVMSHPCIFSFSINPLSIKMFFSKLLSSC